MHETRIIGVGSPFGQDAIAFEVIRVLQEDKALAPYELSFYMEDRPGSRLVSLFEGAKSVYLIDALHAPNEKVGTVKSLTLDELEGAKASHSSHGFGVVEALKLAKSIDLLPEHVMLFGIVVDIHAQSCAPLAPAIKAVSQWIAQALRLQDAL